MLENTIRNFFILITAIYIFYKLLNTRPQSTHVQIISFPLCLLASACTASLFHSIKSLNWLCLFLAFFLIIMYIHKSNLSIIYMTTLFSFSLSFIMLCLSSCFSCLIFIPFYYKNYAISWFVLRTIIGIFQFLLTYFCFRIPRIQKGMIFLYYIPSGNTGSTLCLLLIMLLIMFYQTDSITDSCIIPFLGSTLILAFLLIYWWNYHITQTYRKYLKKNEIDSLNLLLEERNQEITYLRSEHDELARLIHKDNKLIPALSMAIIESYENGTKLDLSALDCDSSLHMKLKQLYEERVEILAAYEKERLKLPETKFNSVNAILSYVHTDALKLNISYQVILFDDLTSTIPDKITEDDFSHMLSDLLANSLNACKDTDSAFIQIYLGIIDGISTIKIYNNGKEFNIETLKNLGLARHTTHASTGGSGIGLMDIWMLKEKYKATLLIDEITDESSSQAYTCIHILFNHKNHYIVQSNRHKELSSYINRPDIMILSKE